MTSFSVFIKINAYIDDDLLATYVFCRQHISSSGCTDDNIRILAKFFRIFLFRLAVADGHGCIRIQKHHCNRLADHKASPQNNCLLACRINAVIF